MLSIGDRGWLWCTLLAACVSVFALPGHAQQGDGVPEGVLTGTEAWTGEQSAAMEAFVSGAIEAMKGQDATEVVEGRDALLKPMRDLRATPAFLRQYYRLLAGELDSVIKGEAAIGKVNALVVAEFVPESSILPVVRDALDSKNAGVRFAAARTLGKLLQNPGLKLSETAKQQQINDLAARAQREPDAYVTAKLLAALAKTDVPNQQTLMIGVLGARVDLHAEDPTLSYQPEFMNMQDLFINGLGQFSSADAREFVRVAARSLLLAAHQLDARVLPPEVAQEAENLVRQSDTVLHELGFGAALRLNPAGAPRRTDAALATDNYGELVGIAQSWETLLQQGQPGFVPFKAEELKVKLPAAEPAADAPADAVAEQ